MKKYLFLIAAALLMQAIVGCGTGKKAFELGSIDDGTYRNAFFGFSMELPDGMYVMPRAEMDSMSRAMGSMTGLGRAEAAAGNKPGEGSDLLLFVSAAKPGTLDSMFNQNVTVTCERLPSALGAKNNEQYMSMVIKMIDRSVRASGNDIPVERTELGGREFMKISMGNGDMSQDVYARLLNGYALVIVGSYDGETQQRSILEILSTIAFE